VTSETTLRTTVNGAAASVSSLSTAALSDAMDRLGIAGQVPNLRRYSGQRVMAGPAFTVRYEPVGTDGGTVGDFVDDVDPGSVIILANAGRLEMTVWGGLLSQVASTRGVAGTVVDGCCRDIDGARLAGYSLFAADVWMRTGKDRVRAEAIQVPVSIGGVRVRPNDLVVGDGDGVLVVPVERVAEGVKVDRLDDVRRRVGYFELQRKSEGEQVGRDPGC
jgi:4-hydroxy-4-methyl-2-oxoglutarate aldolase